MVTCRTITAFPIDAPLWVANRFWLSRYNDARMDKRNSRSDLIILMANRTSEISFLPPLIVPNCFCIRPAPLCYSESDKNFPYFFCQICKFCEIPEPNLPKPPICSKCQNPAYVNQTRDWAKKTICQWYETHCLGHHFVWLTITSREADQLRNEEAKNLPDPSLLLETIKRKIQPRSPSSPLSRFQTPIRKKSELGNVSRLGQLPVILLESPTPTKLAHHNRQTSLPIVNQDPLPPEETPNRNYPDPPSEEPHDHQTPYIPDDSQTTISAASERSIRSSRRNSNSHAPYPDPSHIRGKVRKHTYLTQLLMFIDPEQASHYQTVHDNSMKYMCRLEKMRTYRQLLGVLNGKPEENLQQAHSEFLAMFGKSDDMVTEPE